MKNTTTMTTTKTTNDINNHRIYKKNVPTMCMKTNSKRSQNKTKKKYKPKITRTKAAAAAKKNALSL